MMPDVNIELNSLQRLSVVLHRHAATPFVFWLCFFWPWTDESIVQRVEVVGAQFSEAEPVRDGQFVRFKVFR